MSFAAPPFGGGFKFGSRDAAASGALPAPGGLPYAPLAPPPPFKFASTLQPSAAPRAAQVRVDIILGADGAR